MDGPTGGRPPGGRQLAPPPRLCPQHGLVVGADGHCTLCKRDLPAAHPPPRSGGSVLTWTLVTAICVGLGVIAAVIYHDQVQRPEKERQTGQGTPEGQLARAPAPSPGQPGAGADDSDDEGDDDGDDGDDEDAEDELADRVRDRHKRQYRRRRGRHLGAERSNRGLVRRGGRRDQRGVRNPRRAWKKSAKLSAGDASQLVRMTMYYADW